jgi:ferritin-like metal-binding protein YciE
MAEKTLNDLFLDTLKDIYFAEKQILKALPKMARAAQSEEGKAGFLQHREETQGQIERLEQVFELLGKPARGKTCEAIQGIIAEGEEIMEEYKGHGRARRRTDFVGAGRRALRDRPLRHADRLGQADRPQ